MYINGIRVYFSNEFGTVYHRLLITLHLQL